MADNTGEQVSSPNDIRKAEMEKDISIEKLVERARLEDEDALATIIETYLPGIERHVRGIVGNDWSLVEDIVQETFTRAFSRPENLSSTHLTVLLLAIARNIAMNKKRNTFRLNINSAATNRIQDSFILQIRIEEELLTALTLSTVTTAITDIYTRCWLIQQKRFADLIDYTQTRDPRFVKEANLQVGTMSHNSPAIIDFILNAGGIAGGAATLAVALKIGIDAIAQTPLRFEATKLKNLNESQEQEIRKKQAVLEQQIAVQKAETEDKGKQHEQQLEAERKLFELEKQRILLEIEKQKFEVEAEKERTRLDRERFEFERNRVVIIQEIAVTMVGQLLSSEDRKDAGRTEMLVHSLIPSLLQLSATDAVVTTLPQEKPEDKGSSEKK